MAREEKQNRGAMAPRPSQNTEPQVTLNVSLAYLSSEIPVGVLCCYRFRQERVKNLPGHTRLRIISQSTVPLTRTLAHPPALGSTLWSSLNGPAEHSQRVAFNCRGLEFVVVRSVPGSRHLLDLMPTLPLASVPAGR
jgi:hypothetical protein